MVDPYKLSAYDAVEFEAIQPHKLTASELDALARLLAQDTADRTEVSPS